ncbi:MAG TPA: CAP domain-containing protein, partial [Gaiellaceae bacterium]|nr:CAP domain-containing protein [Gaiellaceae bacterium]
DDPAPPVARSAAERLAACGYDAGSGENIAAGFASAQAVVTAWLNSPGHRANIENPSFVAIGSGAAAGGAGMYWAQDFGTAGDSSPPTTTSPPPGTTTAPPGTTSPPPSTTAPPPGTTTAPPPPRRTSAAPALVMQGLTLAPRRPRANGRLAGTVAVLLHGRRVTTGRVVCRARVGSKAFDVVVHRFRRGKAMCVWRVPRRMHGKLIQAAITVHVRGAQARAPFRARVR